MDLISGYLFLSAPYELDTKETDAQRGFVTCPDTQLVRAGNQLRQCGSRNSPPNFPLSPVRLSVYLCISTVLGKGFCIQKPVSIWCCWTHLFVWQLPKQETKWEPRQIAIQRSLTQKTTKIHGATLNSSPFGFWIDRLLSLWVNTMPLVMLTQVEMISFPFN